MLASDRRMRSKSPLGCENVPLVATYGMVTVSSLLGVFEFLRLRRLLE
jgi:hypothetical protein